MKIRKLRLKNIGVFDDEEIEFQPGPKSDKAEIHILTGENGTGKSTILMALAGAFHDLGKYNQSFSNALRKRFRYFEHHGEIPSDDDFSDIDNDDDDEISFSDINRAAYKSSVLLVLDNNIVSICASPLINGLDTHTPDEKINHYRQLTSSSGRPDTLLEFGVFAYSGYRYIEAREIITAGSSEKTNPLLGSLDFVKQRNQSNGLTINNWIADSILKSAYEKERDPKKSEAFASAVKSLESAIAEITGWKVKFDLRTDPFDLRLKVNDEDLDFDVLPDGLRSLISWIGDLLMRVDSLKWNDDLPAFEKNLILLLDEIEVHLHPAWQRKVLPVVQKLFKNSQIFLSTHSPFVVNSVDGALVYKLKVENGKAHAEKPILSEDGYSYSYVLEEIFGVKEDFGVSVQKRLDEFSKLRDKILENGSVEEDKRHLKELAQDLASQSDELNTIVQFELRQLSKIIKEEISL